VCGVECIRASNTSFLFELKIFDLNGGLFLLSLNPSGFVYIVVAGYGRLVIVAHPHNRIIIKNPKVFIVTSIWGNYIARSDKFPAPVKTGNTAMNAELTYYFSQQFSWTFGGGMSNYTDDLSPSDTLKNYSEGRYSTRISVGF
jgi:hypothetical protein